MDKTAKQIELIDYQSFISKEARDRYFEKIKDSYDYVCFRDIDNIYYLYLYDCPKEQFENWRNEHDFLANEFKPKISFTEC